MINYVVLIITGLTFIFQSECVSVAVDEKATDFEAIYTSKKIVIKVYEKKDTGFVDMTNKLTMDYPNHSIMPTVTNRDTAITRNMKIKARAFFFFPYPAKTVTSIFTYFDDQSEYMPGLTYSKEVACKDYEDSEKKECTAIPKTNDVTFATYVLDLPMAPDEKYTMKEVFSKEKHDNEDVYRLSWTSQWVTDGPSHSRYAKTIEGFFLATPYKTGTIVEYTNFVVSRPLTSWFQGMVNRDGVDTLPKVLSALNDRIQKTSKDTKKLKTFTDRLDNRFNEKK